MRQQGSNILNLIGNTPLVEISKLNPNRKVKVYAKLESSNPGGSVKDRTALYMIERAEARRELTPEKTILEATSGNTGIGLALIAAVKGYRLLLMMSESASEERKKILKAMGAELQLTPAALGTDGAIEAAYNLVRETPQKFFLTDQFNNEDNVAAHYFGTAEEIWHQTEGHVTMVVASLGTCGTAMGISKRLKEYNPAIRIIGVEPYLRHRIQGLKNMKESYRPGIFDKSRLDEKINILDEDAFSMARRLLKEEGILAGMSSGAAMHVALEQAKQMTEGVIVVILPDSAERYLSTELFADREKTTLQIFNTLNRKKDYFVPVHSEEILMYSGGPTIDLVYHIGSFRRFIVSDLVSRYLEFKGYKVKRVIDVIDIADRAIKGAELAGMELNGFAGFCFQNFLRDSDKLNIKRSAAYPKASENVDAMINLAEKLVERGYAYEKLRSVYFDISKLDNYGRLSNIDLGKIRVGKSVDLDEYEKDNPMDFTLLKRSTLSELKRGIFYKTPWGNVRPSWHLESAAIVMNHLGDIIDIYATGSDFIFPHCENVLAIGEAVTGKRTTNYWIHAEMVMMEGKKMSLSLNNYFTLDDLEKKGYSGKDIRYFLIGSHYRQPLNFSFGALDTARNTVRRLNEFVRKLLCLKFGSGFPEVDQYLYDLRKGFIDAMEDDFHISAALAVLFDFINRINRILSKGMLSEADRDKVLDAMKKIDSVLGILDFEEDALTEEELNLIEQREEARQRYDYAESDRLREKLADMGVLVQDTPGGTVWRKKGSRNQDPGAREED